MISAVVSGVGVMLALKFPTASALGAVPVKNALANRNAIAVPAACGVALGVGEGDLTTVRVGVRVAPVGVGLRVGPVGVGVPVGPVGVAVRVGGLRVPVTVVVGVDVTVAAKV